MAKEKKIKFKGALKAGKVRQPDIELKKYEKIIMNAFFGTMWVFWGFSFYLAQAFYSLVYLNYKMLKVATADGTALPIKGVGEDGSMVLFNGVDMPAGSYVEVVPTIRSVGTGYFIPDQAVMVAPLDFLSVVKMADSVALFWGLGTFLMLLTLIMVVANRSLKLPGKQIFRILGRLPGWFPKVSMRGIPILIVITLVCWFATLL